MKIGILTQPLHTNYGGLLQAYALQIVLKRMGHEVITINRCSSTSLLRLPRWILGRLYLNLFKGGNYSLYSRFATRCNEAKLQAKTEQFILKYISASSHIESNKALKRYVSENKFDAYLVGSDQVWRPCYSPYIYSYFFDFAFHQKDIKRVAYAASFGVDNWEFTEKQTNRCAELIQKFDAVSVREDSGIELCQKYLKRNDAQHVLDPTMLLDKEDYMQIVENADTPKSEGTLMTYVLDKSIDKQNIIEKVENAQHLKAFSVIAKSDYYSTKAKLEDCVQPPVEEWLRGFMDAKYVVADSFHGCVFAIIFNKPFLAIGNHSRGMARFDSLFKQFGLEDRLVYSLEDVTTEKIESPIDWEQVNRRREEMKTASLEYLKTALLVQ